MIVNKRTFKFFFSVVKTFKFIGTIFLMVSLANANECGGHRIDKTILKHVPVMDQDGSGICWAYASATLIDAWRFSHGDNKVNLISSPIFLAIDGGGKNTNGEGWAYNVLERQSFYEPTYICDHYHVSKYVKSTDIFIEGFKEWNGYISEKRGKIDVSEFSYCDNRQMESQLKETIFNLRSLSFDILINELLVKRCSKSSIQAVIPKPKRLMRSQIPIDKEKKIAQELRRLFAKDKASPQPVAITYCSDVLFNPDVRSVQTGQDTPQNCKIRHVSAIVGSRPKKNGGCEYLIRNSAGPSCNPYKCSAEYKEKKCCERGQIWLSEEALIDNTWEASWLE